MATKHTRVTYGGINKDVSKAKYHNNRYFDAQNVKLTPVGGQTFGALSNAYGNKLAIKVPIPQIDKSTHKIHYGHTLYICLVSYYYKVGVGRKGTQAVVVAFALYLG